MNYTTAYSFDDISLIPQYSPLDSRDDVDLSTQIGDIQLKIPVITSPMDTVTEEEMMTAIYSEGGLGIHHRYYDKNDLIYKSLLGGIAVSPSMGTEFIDLLMKFGQYRTARPLVVIDVAHGDSKPAIDYAAYCASSGCTVVSGNICTESAVDNYLSSGVNIFRVGVGSGAACTTRRVAGVGIPQVTAIESVRHAIGDSGYIISDGGINHSGDIVKALVVGADAVMIGSLLAGCPEAPGDRHITHDGKRLKRYRGMASGEALDAAGKERNVEGVSGWIPQTAPLHDVIGEMMRGVRAGFAYLGCRNMADIKMYPNWIPRYVLVTSNGLHESNPRI